jgi:hypothetical protein
MCACGKPTKSCVRSHCPFYQGPRGIVGGKIKIAGAIDLAEQLEAVFKKAKGPEKTLAFLEEKRVSSERAKARL